MADTGNDTVRRIAPDVSKVSRFALMKRISEQLEALAVDLRKRRFTYDQIANAICCTPSQARRIVASALKARNWQGHYPELEPLSGRAAGALMRLGVYTKESATRLIRSGQAQRYAGIGVAVIREICAWCNLELVESNTSGYCVKGQMDQEELVQELNENIRLAEQNLREWRRTLAELEFRTGAAPDGVNLDDEWERLSRRPSSED